MKKAILILLSAVLLSAQTYAQHCSQASVNITPRPGTVAGLSPLPENLPCMIVGQPVSDTIYFHNFDTVYLFGNTVIIDSLKIDSIGNLPAGLCWTSNKSNNTFAGGEDGIIYVQGTCTGSPGQYKMRILFEAQTSIGQLPPGSDAESYAGLRYFVRVKCPAASCTPLDTTTGATQAFIPYTQCPGPPPAVITALGNTAICQGASVILSASTGTGYRYKWSTGATTDSITVTSAASYTVTVYNGPDSTVSAPITVSYIIPNAQVYPTGRIDMCPGDTAPLAAITTGLTYAWSNGATTQIINVPTAGVYRLTVTDGNGCTAVSADDSVFIGSLPAAVIIQSGTTLTAGSGTGYTYQWYRDNVLLTGETAQSITVTSNGSYTVYVTGGNSCRAMSPATVVTNVGISDITGTQAIALYPNPSEGILTLETTHSIDDSYTIYDQLGRSIQQRTITAAHMPVDLSTQPSGIYYMTVRHSEANHTIRFALIR